MKRFSIITEDLTKCIECGCNVNINKHEIFGGTAKRQLSIKYGLVIPLCGLFCHNQYDSIGIHFDSSLCEKWHKKGQIKAMQHYGWSKEDFIKIFGRSYL